MPTQKCLRRHDQAMAAPLRQQTSKRGEEGTIGRPQRGAAGLTAEHDELMPQDEQFDVFGELAAPAPDKQPQNSRETEIGEGKEHPPMFPEYGTGGRETQMVFGGPGCWTRRSRVKREARCQGSLSLGPSPQPGSSAISRTFSSGIGRVPPPWSRPARTFGGTRAAPVERDAG
jgi:hypothetical protein